MIHKILQYITFGLLLTVHFCSVGVISNATTITNISLDVAGNLVIPAIIANPSVIDRNQNTMIIADPLMLSTGEILTEIPCILTLSSPATVLVVSSLTDQDGVCTFDTALDPEGQSWLYVSGDQSTLTSLSGTMDVVMEYNTPLGDISTTTNVTINQAEIALEEPIISVDKTNILVNDSVVYTSQPIVYSDGSLYANGDVVLVLRGPNGVFRFAGKTNAQGIFTINFGSNLSEQGINVLDGDPDNLFTTTGKITAILEVQDISSNEPVTDIEDRFIIPIFDDLPRTGGFGITILAILAVSVAMIVIFNRSRKRKVARTSVGVS